MFFSEMNKIGIDIAIVIGKILQLLSRLLYTVYPVLQLHPKIALQETLKGN